MYNNTSGKARDFARSCGEKSGQIEAGCIEIAHISLSQG
jgi:hypothetical protein